MEYTPKNLEYIPRNIFYNFFVFLKKICVTPIFILKLNGNIKPSGDTTNKYTQHLFFVFFFNVFFWFVATHTNTYTQYIHTHTHNTWIIIATIMYAYI